MRYSESRVNVNPTRDEVFDSRCLPHGSSGQYLLLRAHTAENISSSHILMSTVASPLGMFSSRGMPVQNLVGCTSQFTATTSSMSSRAMAYCASRTIRYSTHHSGGWHSPATNNTGVGRSKQPSTSTLGGSVNVAIVAGPLPSSLATRHPLADTQ